MSWSSRDFFVDWIPDKRQLAVNILDYSFLERVRCQKNTIVIVTGDSGEAKSSMVQAMAQELFKKKGMNYKDYVTKCTVFTPLEYSEKMNNLINNEDMKNVDILIIDEARLVVKAKHWQSFLNQAIGDILALVRRKKRILLFVITQDLNDIDKDVRRQITFWGECTRPLHCSPEIKFWRFYKDTLNPDNIVFRKRKFKGVVVKDGKWRLIEPSAIEFGMPDREIWDIYDEANYVAKSAILDKKMKEVLDAIKREYGIDSDRVSFLSSWYSKPENFDSLSVHLKFVGNKYFLRKGALDFLGITKEEGKRFLGLIKPFLAKSKESDVVAVSELSKEG